MARAAVCWCKHTPSRREGGIFHTPPKPGGPEDAHSLTVCMPLPCLTKRKWARESSPLRVCQACPRGNCGWGLHVVYGGSPRGRPGRPGTAGACMHDRYRETGRLKDWTVQDLPACVAVTHGPRFQSSFESSSTTVLQVLQPSCRMYIASEHPPPASKQPTAAFARS